MNKKLEICFFYFYFYLKVTCTAASNDQPFKMSRVSSSFSPTSPIKTTEVDQLLSVDCNVNSAESTHTLSPTPGEILGT